MSFEDFKLNITDEEVNIMVDMFTSKLYPAS